jgi:formyl-CoA transferase
MMEWFEMSLLQGLRVLGVSTVIAAPFAVGLMADFGADEIRIKVWNEGFPAVLTG